MIAVKKKIHNAIREYRKSGETVKHAIRFTWMDLCKVCPPEYMETLFDIFDEIDEELLA